jgi:hypothetical protein
MFPYIPNNLADPFNRPEHVSHTMLLNRAVNLFNQARWNSALEKAKRIFLGGVNALFDLESIPTSMVRNRRYGGIKPVSIDAIRGTLGRVQDFDSEFNPLDDRIRDRWVGIAVVRSCNIPLTPVELIEVNGVYFVIDGHHRISVARALGETMVDAEIIIWNVCCALPWEKQPATHTIPLAV